MWLALVSQDISYRTWHVGKRVASISVVGIDSGAKAEIHNVDPRFTTGTCKALLSAIGIWVDSKSILIDEVFDSEGTASRTMSVNVSIKDVDRLVSISRSFTWNNEKMKVLFTGVDPVLVHTCAHASSGSFKHCGTPTTTPTSSMTNKRSHKPTTTQPRLIKTKLEDVLMSGQDESVAYTGAFH